MKIYILRHLQTTDNEQGINGAQTDTPLSDSGMKQAQEIIPVLSEHTYDMFIVSPLQRTLQTIQPYLKTLNNPKVLIEALTIERDLGTLTNSRDGDGLIEKSREGQGVGNISWTPPQGESIRDVHKRAEIFLSVIRKLDAGSILVSGHQNFLRCFEMCLLDKPIDDFYTEHLTIAPKW